MHKITFISISLLLNILAIAQNVPSAIAYMYEATPDWEISDDFNASRANDAFDTTKWHYRLPTRNRVGLATDSHYVQEKDGKLICYGRKETRKAGAIISNQHRQFGWYTFRWKTTGVNAKKRNAWHPAIWGAYQNSKNESAPGTTGIKSNWMEIDIVEFNSWSTTMTEWSADAPAYLWVDSLHKKVKVNSGRGPGFGWKKAVMFDGQTDTYKGEVLGGDNFDQWQTWGMEYHPEYLQMWKLDGDTWVKVGHTIIFTDNDMKPTIRTVPRQTLSPLYWYMGSLYMPQNKSVPIKEDQISNSTLEVDWFHFYPYKKKEEENRSGQGVFPFALPKEKPNIPLSASSKRMFEYEAPRAQDNELFSQFKYTRLKGFDYNGGDGTVSRRDPSRPILVDGKYYIYYTKRHTKVPPVGWNRAKEATDVIPSTDWDLADIWYATSKDGITWEEQGPAVQRPEKPKPGWRSLATPDILVWKGKYYLYYQAFDEPSGLRGDLCPVSVSYADSPEGPWTHGGDAVIPFGKEGEWDQNATHDPHPIIFNGKIYIYYKAAYNKWPDKRDKYAVGHGLVTADNPLGPFTKHPLNPVMQSGHETTYFPFRDGVATLAIKDGAERETVQFSKDGANFEIASHISFTPTAAAPYIPNLFVEGKGNRGFRWGLCHFVNAGTPEAQYSIIARFDCDLSLDYDEPAFKKTGVFHRPEVYFEQGMETLYEHPEGRYKKVN